MRRIKKALPSLLTFCLLVLMMMTAGATTAQAASKDGLVKKGSKYYYYKNGQKITNKWKTLRVKGTKYRFYFGANGAAYKAADNFDMQIGSDGELKNIPCYNVAVKKIGNKKYGFDTGSHRVGKGVYVDKKSRILVFKSNGVYDAAAAAAYRKQFKGYSAGGAINKTLRSDLISAFGLPVSSTVSNDTPCASWDGLAFSEFNTVTVEFKYFEVQLLHRIATDEYGILGFFSTKIK